MGGCTVWIKRFMLAMVVIYALTGVAAAQSSPEEDLKNQINQIANFVSVIVFAIAVPNGGYGLFEYMTAGTDTESTQKGKKRIRNSFVAVAGVGVIQVAVRFLGSLLGLTGGTP